MDIHLGLLQRISFVILKAAHTVQYFLSVVFWNLIGQPLIFLAWKMAGDADHGHRRITLKKGTTWYFLGLFIEKIMILNGWLNGLKNHYNSYELLLRWNPRIPLIALQHQKTNYTMYRLGSESSENKGIYPIENMTLLGTSKVYGHFMIVDKKFIGSTPTLVSIDGVWLSGDNQGEKFTVTKFGIGANRNETLPESVYFPPRAVVWLFEVLISVSAIATLGSIIYHVWDYLRKIGFEWF